MRTVLKWIGILLGGLLVLVFIALVSVYFITEARINKTYQVSVAGLNIPAEPVQDGRQYPLAVVELCRECHGQDFAGQVMEDDPLIGRLVSANLTTGKGGIGGKYTPEDWTRALRHGLDREGKSLIGMPSSELKALSDTDLGIIVGVIQNSPPIDHELPQTALGPMGRFFLLQKLPVLTAEHIDHSEQPPVMPQVGVTAEYGQYLSHLCTLCHGENLAGTDRPGSGLNLTPGGDLAGWSEADLINTMRTGVAPDGEELDQEMMPVRVWGKLTDDELRAIWLYLKTLPSIVTPTATPVE